MILIFKFFDRLDEGEFDQITADAKRRLQLTTEPVYLSLKTKKASNRFFRPGIADLKATQQLVAKSRLARNLR